MAERWQAYCTQLPGERWPDQAVAQVATSALDARLAHQLRYYEAEIDKAAHIAQQAEERTTQRSSRRGKALAHNETLKGRRAHLADQAERARAELAGERQRLTAGMGPEEVTAIDAARDAQRAEQARLLEVVRSDRHRREHGWGRGLTRDPGPEERARPRALSRLKVPSLA